jgi:serine/threonine protein kinase
MSIPAIFSAYCDGDLASLRAKHRELFLYQDGKASALWQRCGLHIASAIDYMKYMEVAHTDIKLDNVFYVYEDDRSITCKVSDFGLCYDLPATKPIRLQTTTYYRPPNWPEGKIQCDPLVFTVYNFACTMASLLAIPNVKWPSDLEDPSLDFKSFYDEFYSPTLPRNMFCQNLDNNVNLKKRHPVWWSIACILKEDFASHPTDSKYEYIENFIQNILALEDRPQEIAIPMQRRRLDS